jgi:DNA processing protein
MKQLLLTSVSSNRQAALGFNYFQKIGPKRLKLLWASFPNWLGAWQANQAELVGAGLSTKLAEEFIAWRASFSIARATQTLERENINYCLLEDTLYPEQLKAIPDAPPLLYYIGDLGWLGHQQGRDCLAIVGSRRHSAYATKIITKLGPELRQAKIKIISGLASGVDSLAHQAALDNQGRTAAVLGSGLAHQRIYPAQNKSLAAQIVNAGGVLISELPPDTPPLKQNFPRRNRLISGLSQATLVVEAYHQSGALLTAKHAKQQHRLILAIPGSIFSEFSSGPNTLIRQGALAITSPLDVLEVFKIETNSSDDCAIFSGWLDNRQIVCHNNPTEKIVYELIKQASEQNETISADQIIQSSQLDTATINSTLSILELAGRIRLLGSGYELNN